MFGRVWQAAVWGERCHGGKRKPVRVGLRVVAVVFGWRWFSWRHRSTQQVLSLRFDFVASRSRGGTHDVTLMRRVTGGLSVSAMSESMSSPWIRDYLVDVAETCGAQFYSAPVTTTKKKVQLADVRSPLPHPPILTVSLQFLTYQGNSYVWAWISDKDHRVSVRISQDAVDEYKRSVELALPLPRFSQSLSQ